jgi:hypothetical protein
MAGKIMTFWLESIDKGHYLHRGWPRNLLLESINVHAKHRNFLHLIERKNSEITAVRM